MKYLILGGARSGKSRHAQNIAEQCENQGLKVSFLATADTQHNDEAMRDRVEKHQNDRPSHWPTLEYPIELAMCLSQQAKDGHCILVDCLTLWVTNCLLAPTNCWPKQKQALLDIIESLPGTIIFVSNEVGSGIVPMGELSRRFVDETGWLHQQLAQRCEKVDLVIAGLPQALKSA